MNDNITTARELRKRRWIAYATRHYWSPELEAEAAEMFERANPRKENDEREKGA